MFESPTNSIEFAVSRIFQPANGRIALRRVADYKWAIQQVGNLRYIASQVNLASLLNITDYCRAAKDNAPKDVLDYFEGGALDEITLRENTAGWERLKLHYRVLAGVKVREMATTVLGQPISMPIAVAPTAFHRLACEAGELSTARAAKAARSLFILSSLSNTAMEAVFAEADTPKWFQLYIYKDRAVTGELVQRAEAAGAEAIVHS